MPSPERAPLVAIVLAAGASQRFGSDKRFAKMAGGKTFIEATLAALSGHTDAVYVAIRPDDAIGDHWPQTSPAAPIHYIRAPRADQGMGCSLADAARQLPAGSDVVVALADMPFIERETIGRLARHFQRSNKNAPIVFPQWGAALQRGHPVFFHRSYREELENVRGDKGASSIILRHPDALDPLTVEDRGVLVDIDQPTDLPGPEPGPG